MLRSLSLVSVASHDTSLLYDKSELTLTSRLYEAPLAVSPTCGGLFQNPPCTPEVTANTEPVLLSYPHIHAVKFNLGLRARE